MADLKEGPGPLFLGQTEGRKIFLETIPPPPLLSEGLDLKLKCDVSYMNYLLLIAKVYLWDCRRSETLPNITGFKLKVKNKYETEKYICIKNNTIEKFTRKWAITSGSVLL